MGSIPVRVANLLRVLLFFLLLLLGLLALRNLFHFFSSRSLQQGNTSSINAPPAMDQIEPYRQIVQLQSEIVKISRRNRELRERCDELERVLMEEIPVAGKGSNHVETAEPVVREGLWFRLRFWLSKTLNACRPFRWLRV
jgi:hypothetical protein